jgi:hypothetical protein
MSEKCQQETHVLRNDKPYSITSLTRAMINCGIVRPSALAVFRLMTSSKWLA